MVARPPDVRYILRRLVNGVEPLAWLTDVLERVVSGRTKAHELERLLPWAWKAARPVDT
jgi:transposase